MARDTITAATTVAAELTAQLAEGIGRRSFDKGGVKYRTEALLRYLSDLGIEPEIPKVSGNRTPTVVERTRRWSQAQHRPQKPPADRRRPKP